MRTNYDWKEKKETQLLLRSVTCPVSGCPDKHRAHCVCDLLTVHGKWQTLSCGFTFESKRNYTENGGLEEEEEGQTSVGRPNGPNISPLTTSGCTLHTVCWEFQEKHKKWSNAREGDRDDISHKCRYELGYVSIKAHIRAECMPASV